MLTHFGPRVVFLGCEQFPISILYTAGWRYHLALAAGCPVIYKGHPVIHDTSKFSLELYFTKTVKNSGFIWNFPHM